MTRTFTSKFYFHIFIGFILCFNLSVTSVKAQMVYVPDINFRNALILRGYGPCFTGDSINSTCTMVINTGSLNFNGGASNIQSLEGIQAFINLQSLKCAYNSISSFPTFVSNYFTYLDCRYNFNLVATASFPSTLTYLNCEGCSALSGITAVPPGLHFLDISRTNFSTLPSLPTSMDTLLVDFTSITNILSLPNSLKYFSCEGNSITSLPWLPASLLFLDCKGSLITALPAIPFSLIYLDCSFNQLSTIPVLPSNLTSLDCSHNFLTSLPVPLPPFLSHLSCFLNQITTLPFLPTVLRELNCSYNLLTSLPTLPSSLYTLDCTGNQITTTGLPSLPSGLSEFFLSQNLIDTLPSIPYGMYMLYCSSNQLSTLPALPAGLTYLRCDHNHLSTIPALTSTQIFEIDCNNNQLTSLPNFPTSLYYMSCDSNPNLTCLPQLGTMSSLNFRGTAITCLPNYGNVQSSNPPLSSLPLCGLFNPSGCNVYSNISGRTFYDSNSNCAFDSADVNQPNVHVMLYKNGSLHQQIFTGGEGLYSFDLLDTGNYSIQSDTANFPFNVLCPAGNSYNDTITSPTSMFYNNNFSFVCKPGFDVGVQSIDADRFRPARLGLANIFAGDLTNFYGVHCAQGISGSVTVVINGPVHFVAPAPGALTPSNVLGNTITYNITDFASGNLFSDFNMIVRTDTFALVGTPVCITVSVLPTIGDYNPSNNTLTQCYTVRSSFDPNEKEADPDGDVLFSGDRWITYTVHFQNTGSAPAENIYILDTLNQNLDLSTFQLLGYSFQPIVQILEGGFARFYFPGINLIDSNTNEPLSHGYVQYRIKLIDSAGIGTQIQNTANIYFDYNSPVRTNTTLNTVVVALGVAPVKDELSIQVFPNPSHNGFTVYCPQFLSERKITLILFDALGKEVLSETMSSSNCQLHTAGLPSGIYFLRIESTNGVTMKKLIKH